MGWESEVRYNQARIRDGAYDPWAGVRWWRKVAVIGWLLAWAGWLVVLVKSAG